MMFREVMALFHGTELLFGTLLGSSVIWTSSGAAAAEFFLNRRLKSSSRFDPLKLLVYSTLFNGFILALQIIFLRFYPLIYSTRHIPQAFSFYGAVKTVFFASFPFAFLMGAQFTLSLRVNPKKKLGFLYRVESIGAMAGGMLTSFVLVEIAAPLRITFITGALFITGFTFALKNINKKGWHPQPKLNQTVTAFILVLLAVLPLDRLSLEFYRAKKSGGFSLVEVKESRYGRIEVLKNPEANQFMIFHNSALVSSVEPGSENRFERHLAEICLTQHPAPARVLLIGGALSTLPENILKHGIEELKTVELDPLLFKIFEKYSNLSLDLNVTKKNEKSMMIPISVFEDGRSFVLSEPKNHYDLVIIFCPEPDNASVNRFCTREFFLQVNRILKPKGAFCLFLPTHGAAHEYLSETLIERTASVYKAIKSVFKHRLAVQVNGHLLMGSQSEKMISVDPEILGKRLSLRPDARPFYQFEEKGELKKEKIPDEELPAYFSSLFGGILEQRGFLFDSEIETTQRRKFQNRLDASNVKINLDSHPAAVYRSMKVWESITAPESGDNGKRFLSKIFDFFGEGNVLYLMIFPGVFVCIHLMFLIIMYSFSGYLKKHKQSVFHKMAKNYPVLMAAFITGCFSITIEIILFSFYQSLTGYLYYSVGILLAIFMGGLALGAKVTDKQTKNSRITWVQLTMIFLSMILLCFIIGHSSILLSGLKSKAVVTSIFAVLMLINGILCGAAFPVLGSLTTDWKSGRPGAWVYALDLAGAGVGAFFIAPFLIPTAGIQNTLVILGILLSSLLILSIPQTRTTSEK
jgi:spermidine synthase